MSMSKEELSDLINRLQITMQTSVCKHPTAIRKPDPDCMWYCPICGDNGWGGGFPKVMW